MKQLMIATLLATGLLASPLSRAQDAPGDVPGIQPGQQAPNPYQGVQASTSNDTGEFNAARLEGEWASSCLVAPPPPTWPSPQGVQLQPNVFRKVFYSFHGQQVLFRVDAYADALCNEGPLGGSVRAEPGVWRLRRINTFDKTAGEIVFIFDYCSGEGCPPPNTNVVFPMVAYITFRNSMMFFGGLDHDGQVKFNLRQPLWTRGTEPGVIP